jgi:hypothetical protein
MIERRHIIDLLAGVLAKDVDASFRAAITMAEADNENRLVGLLEANNALVARVRAGEAVLREIDEYFKRIGIGRECEVSGADVIDWLNAFKEETLDPCLADLDERNSGARNA